MKISIRFLNIKAADNFRGRVSHYLTTLDKFVLEHFN